MEQHLKEYFNRYVSFEDKEIKTFLSKCEYKTYQKKDFILQEGNICKYQYFILEGLVRSYYIDKKGNEKITQFAIENWWFTNMESFIKETPSHLFIQCIEDSKILMISNENLEKLYIAIPKLERLFRLINQNMIIAIQKKNDFLSKLKSKDRYSNLVDNFPDFAQRVPLFMIASYLEITPEYLSEIRKK
ncbi:MULTISPECIES: Crp/Fnr family transcriptional regulator [Flavobacterium]|uniref:Crp/Fnr family transcriptional regulator n=1 Tax=Flavobacterium jumunjinense TaxID=998845 RepID=A0ABV5GM13_9FLAO|nr:MULTISPECIES: Crp/Fnr family transcriptional regulator [Flavobacterium]